MSDALYASSKEPWSQFLTGAQGTSPGYDPLAFAITEAHARGIELHAWINPFRAASNASARLAANHVAKQHPEWVRRYGAQLWVDPGEPAAREYVLGVITDLVSRYDLDGVHIDDYFYPYPLKGGASFPDESIVAALGRQDRPEPRRLAAGEHQRLRAFDVSDGEIDQAGGTRRHQPVWHLAPRHSGRNGSAARCLRPALCRLTQMARGRVVRLHGAAALLEHRRQTELPAPARLVARAEPG